MVVFVFVVELRVVELVVVKLVFVLNVVIVAVVVFVFVVFVYVGPTQSLAEVAPAELFSPGLQSSQESFTIPL